MWTRSDVTWTGLAELKPQDRPRDREGDVRGPEETGSLSACHGVSREVSHAQWSVSLWAGGPVAGGPYSSNRGHGGPQVLTPVISSGPRSAGSDPGRQGPPGHQ
ncbi:unnamed protein product [Arctogadus glacialis]